jgi:hypothetical protein
MCFRQVLMLLVASSLEPLALMFAPHRWPTALHRAGGAAAPACVASIHRGVRLVGTARPRACSAGPFGNMDLSRDRFCGAARVRACRDLPA